MTKLASTASEALLDGHEIDQPNRALAFQKGQLLAGRYVVERLFARGGMGEIYEARHAQLGKRVAIKTLLSHLGTDSARRRFEREARVLATLENEHIVSVFDFGASDDGRMFLVMEYLVGVDLRSLLREEGTLVAPRAVRLLVQVCRGLSAAHAAGAVHRDLKPENVMVCRHADGSEVCKILDFGLVKLREERQVQLRTRTGAALGTLSYMSPEQARGDRHVDHRSDVYSTAAMLYEALSGDRPHDADSALALVHKIVNERPSPLHTRCDVPRGLSDVVQRALAVDPNDRFQSADELAAALRPYATPELAVDTRETTAIFAATAAPLHRAASTWPWRLGLALTFLAMLAVLAMPQAGRRLGRGGVSLPLATRVARSELSTAARESASQAPSPAASSGFTLSQQPPRQPPTAVVPGPSARAPANVKVPRAIVVRPSASSDAVPANSATREAISFDRQNPYATAR